MATNQGLQAGGKAACVDHRAEPQETRMPSRRRTAGLVGALFLFSNVTFLLGAFGFVESVLGALSALTSVPAGKSG